MAKVPFSERVGAVLKPEVGLNEMPTRLRVSLWNSFEVWLFSKDLEGLPYSTQAVAVYRHLRWPTDEVPHHMHHYDAKERLKAWFFSAQWHEVYDFIEWLPSVFKLGQVKYDSDRRTWVKLTTGQIAAFTSALEREGAPYRLLNGELVPITTAAELDEVASASKAPFTGAREHIAQATTLLSLKPTPDYRNCIKESVSAVESVLKEATGLNMNNLPALLGEFEKKHGKLHPAFREAVSRLYGWTSGDSGIRHSIFGDVNVDHADARFMLVTCSAFVNFLAQHAAKA